MNRELVERMLAAKEEELRVNLAAVRKIVFGPNVALSAESAAEANWLEGYCECLHVTIDDLRGLLEQ